MKLINVDELGNTKNVRETLLTVIEYLKTTLRKNTIKFLGSKFKIFSSFFYSEAPFKCTAMKIPFMLPKGIAWPQS